MWATYPMNKTDILEQTLDWYRQYSIMTMTYQFNGYLAKLFDYDSKVDTRIGVFGPTIFNHYHSLLSYMGLKSPCPFCLCLIIALLKMNGCKQSHNLKNLHHGSCPARCHFQKLNLWRSAYSFKLFIFGLCSACTCKHALKQCSK